jgi:sulfatase modifying factor 1
MKKYTFAMLLTGFITVSAFGQTPAKPQMVFVEGGSFTMGSYVGPDDEHPIHTVTIGSFNISKYEVTVGEYKAFCTATGRKMRDVSSRRWSDQHPMGYVSFDDAKAYCKWLSEVHGANYRLPTEAEWEYAARGGIKSSAKPGKKINGYSYAGSDNLEEVGWSQDQSQVVGGKKPNELGIYDMSGNVLEWCEDWYGDYPYDEQANPKGPSSGSHRVLRGGSWASAAARCTVVSRHHALPNEGFVSYGFRVVLAQSIQ